MYYNIVFALAIFVPLVVAMVGIKAGAASWTFLTLCACAQTLILLMVSRPLALIVWLIAWGCAIAARSSRRHPKGDTNGSNSSLAS